MDIGDSAERGLDSFFGWLPNLLGALVILLVGWLVARAIAWIVVKGLRKAQFDTHARRGMIGRAVASITDRPSVLLGNVVFWLVMLGVVSLAVTTLGIDALTAFVAAVYDYLPHVLAAALIFVVAALVSAAVTAFVQRVMGGTATGRVIATVAPVLIMTIASFMILTELMIAEEIVLITYAALLGAVALGSALAFGLGGRDVAARLLEDAYRSGQEHKEDVKRDLAEGRAKSQQLAEEVGERARSASDEGAQGGAAGSTAGDPPAPGEVLPEDAPTVVSTHLANSGSTDPVERDT